MDRDLASVVVGARRAAGLSQAELARRAGISASYLSRIEGAAWERGGPWPTDGVLRALARALGLSSTDLVALRRTAREGQGVPDQRGRAGPGRRVPYAVAVGHDDVDAAAVGLVERNRPRGALRSVQVLVGDAGGQARRPRPGEAVPPSYLDALGAAVAEDPGTLLYRVTAVDRRGLDTARAAAECLTGGRPPEELPNVRMRIRLSNPLVFDVLIGDHEVLLAVPDRRGHPFLRAGVVVDDPDFVSALREWFDEFVWDGPGGYADVRGAPVDEAPAGVDARLGAEQDLDPAGPGVVGPSAHADVPEGRRHDVLAVGGRGDPAVLQQGSGARLGGAHVVAPGGGGAAPGDGGGGARVVGQGAVAGHLLGVAGRDGVEAAVSRQRL